MSKIELYDALERMVLAAENNNYEVVVEINKEFSTLYHHMLEKHERPFVKDGVELYDWCRNVAVYSVTVQPNREKFLQKTRSLFSEIPKPE